MFKAIKDFLFGTPAATVQPVVQQPAIAPVLEKPAAPKKKRTFVKRTEPAQAKPKTAAPAKPKAQPAAKKPVAAATAPKKANNRRRKPKDWSVK